MIDKLLNKTISQHGYLLINNRALIEDDLKKQIKLVGYEQTVKLLDNYRGVFCEYLYKKIELARDQRFAIQ